MVGERKTNNNSKEAKFLTLLFLFFRFIIIPLNINIPTETSWLNYKVTNIWYYQQYGRTLTPLLIKQSDQ